MADFEIEDDDNEYSFTSAWNTRKSGGGMFGGGGDEDNMYDFEVEDKKPVSKSKRGSSFSPGSSIDSQLSPVKKVETKPKPATQANTGSSALDLASSMLAKYAAKPAVTTSSNPFAKKKISAEFDEDDISVESDDVEDFEMSDSPEKKPTFTTGKDVKGKLSHTTAQQKPNAGGGKESEFILKF